MRLFGLNIEARAADMRSVDPVVRREDFFFDAATSCGPVTADNATNSSAVYSCVRLISETVGSIPLILYQRLPDGGKKRATDHPLYWVLGAQPNVRNTRMELIEAMLWHLLLRGNAYLRIKFVRGNVQLELLHPDRMSVRVLDSGRMAYTYADSSGTNISFTQFDIVHVRGPSTDGVLGKSAIQFAKDTVYRSATMEEFHTNSYKNGIRSSGLLEAEHDIDDEQAKRLADNFRTAYSGAANSGKVILLDPGLKYQQLSMTLEDAQFIEGRKLTRSEVCGIFGVAPHMIGDLSQSSFNNMENMTSYFSTYTLRTHLVRLESAFMRDLLTDEQERQEYFIEFLQDALIRADIVARSTAKKMDLESGQLTFNEARALENRNPLPWGDATMIPLNFRPVSKKEDLDSIKNQPPTSNANPAASTPPPDTGTPPNEN